MKTHFQPSDTFEKRHIGIRSHQLDEMLKVMHVDSMDQLMKETIPESIWLEKPLSLPEALSEHEFLDYISKKIRKNKVFKSYIGLGYHPTITPSVIKRNIFNNPGWYTQYTPYQAEIAQGRLEALLNFQTAICDLTGLEVANASLLDEGTAAAEAMIMFFHSRNKRNIEAKRFFVSEQCLPQTIDILKTKAEPRGIELHIGKHNEFAFDEQYFGGIVQYPAQDGKLFDYSDFITDAHQNKAYVVVAADILSLALLKTPAEMGADAAIGNTQRLGVPMGFGGPHAAYFATRDQFKRKIPGRIIGVSVDRDNNEVFRMALQTREQHIRREKATSNICTAQALLAIMAGMYAVYHGKEGITNIAEKVHSLAVLLADELVSMGFRQLNNTFFDNLLVDPSSKGINSKQIRHLAEKAMINFRYFEDGTIGINLNEASTLEEVRIIGEIFKKVTEQANRQPFSIDSKWEINHRIPENLIRKSDFLSHPVFSKYRSETEMMRYIKRLENKDLSLTRSMIPLGSCTMKLNAASELLPLDWPELADMHPFVPVNQAEGYLEVIHELEADLCEITRFEACSLQPNSGAQGEYAGLMVIRAYHMDRNDHERNVVLIPFSAHGTNPASAIMAGMKVVVVACDDKGNIDLNDLKSKAEEYSDRLAAIMVTYPSTHGVFEVEISAICQIVHDNGGLVYMDGANMNAQVGLTSPAKIGADVCHLNLHKTFGIPHGGGGPGMGPICVNEKLKDYLPGHPLFNTGGKKAIHAISATPFGSASILVISYGYIRMLGSKGCTNATKFAILNANYLKSKLERHYPILYSGENGRVAHEFIIDVRDFKQAHNIDVDDLAKRLIDYGFHAPTVSFPVSGTMMIEPTESESLEELDRFCQAMIEIRKEIQEVEAGHADPENNVLKNAPHTLEWITSDEWPFPYSRRKAVYPLPWVSEFKFWSPVSRIDSAYGDRHLICTCPPIEAYQSSLQEEVENL